MKQKKKVKLNTPMKSTRKDKKLMVKVVNPKTGRINTVHFGQKGYSDYTKHKNKSRRKSFRARHKCYSKKDITKPGYWACKVLWGK